MKLADFLDKDLVLPALRASSQKEVLVELVAPLAGKFPGFDSEKTVRVLLERESLGSTGIGDGIAIPHGKFDWLERAVVVVGQSRNGVDFAAIDFQPVYIFFMVLTPERGMGTHLRLLAHISRVLQDEAFRRAFMECADLQELWRLLQTL